MCPKIPKIPNQNPLIPKSPIFDGDSLRRVTRVNDERSSCFVVAYIYLDRFVHSQPLLPINSFDVHRLLITSVLVSVKFMDDISD
ncbi:hypothetical protein ACSBR2_008821 [Camellia fascicularis]